MRLTLDYAGITPPGMSAPRLGGGRIVEPMRIFVAGRAANGGAHPVAALGEDSKVMAVRRDDEI